jgi:hypothetical protein
VNRGFAGEEYGRRRRLGARGEMRVRERAKRREEELLKALDWKRRAGGLHTGAIHDGGKVAAEQSSGREQSGVARAGLARGEG